MKKILDYLNENYKIDVSKINEDTNIMGYLGMESGETLLLSSLEYVDLIVYIEKEFNIIFDFDAELRTIKDIKEYIVLHGNQEKYMLDLNKRNIDRQE